MCRHRVHSPMGGLLPLSPAIDVNSLVDTLRGPGLGGGGHVNLAPLTPALFPLPCPPPRSRCRWGEGAESLAPALGCTHQECVTEASEPMIAWPPLKRSNQNALLSSFTDDTGGLDE